MKYLLILLSIIYSLSSSAFDASLIEGDIVKIIFRGDILLNTDIEEKVFFENTPASIDSLLTSQFKLHMDKKRYTRVIKRDLNYIYQFEITNISTINFKNKDYALNIIELKNIDPNSEVKRLTIRFNRGGFWSGPITQNYFFQAINFFVVNNDSPMMIKSFIPDYSETKVVR